MFLIIVCMFVFTANLKVKNFDCTTQEYMPFSIPILKNKNLIRAYGIDQTIASNEQEDSALQLNVSSEKILHAIATEMH